LLASLLRSCSAIEHVGRWPNGWAAAPACACVTGIELMPRDVQRARAALGEAAEFICGDMQRTLAQWIALLESLGFELRSRSMSEGTPFANVLLVACVKVPA
jgi:hypothetical protein